MCSPNMTFPPACHLCFSPCWQSFSSSAELPHRAMYMPSQTTPLPLSFITMFYAYSMLCRRNLRLIAIKYAQRHGFSPPSVHAVLINVNVSYVPCHKEEQEDS